MPETRNTGRAFTRQDGRLRIIGGNLVLMPPSAQFATMDIEQLEQVDAAKLDEPSLAAYTEAIEREMMKMQEYMTRIAEAAARRNDYRSKENKDAR